MDTQYDLVQAILFIRPDAEFAVRNMQIEWLDEKQTQPTDQEIAQALIDYKAKVEADKLDKLAKKAAAEAKLAALGLDADDLAALGLV
jgi:hypothetical protein